MKTTKIMDQQHIVVTKNDDGSTTGTVITAQGDVTKTLFTESVHGKVTTDATTTAAGLTPFGLFSLERSELRETDIVSTKPRFGLGGVATTLVTDTKESLERTTLDTGRIGITQIAYSPPETTISLEATRVPGPTAGVYAAAGLAAVAAVLTLSHHGKPAHKTEPTIPVTPIRHRAPATEVPSTYADVREQLAAGKYKGLVVAGHNIQKELGKAVETKDARHATARLLDAGFVEIHGPKHTRYTRMQGGTDIVEAAQIADENGLKNPNAELARKNLQWLSTPNGQHFLHK